MVIKHPSTITPLGEGQYKIVSCGKVYDTRDAEFCGCLPIHGDTSTLYKDKEYGYYIVDIASLEDNKPAFTKLNDSEGRLWEKGIERYWESKL